MIAFAEGEIEVRQGLSLVVLLSLMLFPAFTLAQEPELVFKKVAVLPFAVLSKVPMDYLGEKVRQEFQERFRAEGFTLVSQEDLQRELAKLKEPPGDTSAREIGHKVGAEAVVFGQLIIVGEALSLETRLLDLTGRMPPASFKSQGVGLASLAGLARSQAQEAGLKILGKERLVRIDIKGNRRIDADAVLGAMQTREGDIVSPLRLREDLKSIYKMGYFTDVKFDISDTPQGRVLTVLLVEKPAIREIVIRGNRKIKRDKILETIDIKPFTVVSEAAIRNNINKILKLYGEKGYYEAKVDYTIQPISDTEVDLIFLVNEGVKLYIKEIRFEGNRAFKDKQLRGVMETKKRDILTWFTGSGKLDRDVLDRDVEKIAAFYYNHGYIKAKVGEPKVDIRQQRIFITIPIEEGPQYRVGRVELQGDLLEDKDKLLKRLEIPKEKIYSREVIQKDLSTLADFYADHGYANADITPLIKENEPELSVDIVFDISQGKKVYFERIEVAGNIKTRDKVIRRELRVYEQELFSATNLKESLKNLRRLEFFEDVNFSTSPGATPERMNLKVTVKERPTGTFGVGAGYSTQDRLVGMVEISQINLFGRGQQLRLQGIVGAVTSRYRLSFTEPYLFDRPLSFGLDAYNWERDYDEYTRKDKGGALRLAHPLRWKYTRLYGSYRFENVKISGLSAWSSPILIEAANIQNTSAISLTLRRDSRDALFTPTKGSDNSISLEMAGVGGQVGFLRYVAESAWYFPLVWSTVGVLHGRFGYMHNLPALGLLPAYEKFYLGGIDSIRGFRYAEISPRDPTTLERIGGNMFSQINVEYRFPMPFLKKVGIMGVVFFDAGNVYGRHEVGPTFRTSVGTGFRWYSPMGPLRVEWGYNLSKKPWEKASAWEFSIGSSF